MPRTLHILTERRNDWPADLRAWPGSPNAEDSTPSQDLTFDLTSGIPDYEALLDAIVQSEAIHVW